ncbi:AAA-like domain protein [compost metagenome]
MHENIDSMDRQDWIEASLQYLSVASIKRERALVRSSLLMMVSGEKGENFDVVISGVEKTARDLGISLTRVLYDIPELIAYFSPFSRTFSKTALDIVPIQVLTDELVARYSTYSQGTLGLRGICFGVDVYSRFPILKVIKVKSDTAENIIISAETGGGKSHLVKDLTFQILALNCNGTIMDIEGFEYIPLANFISRRTKVAIVNMAEGTGNYFDPVEIPPLTGIESVDVDLKKTSTDFTLATLKTLYRKAYDSNILVDSVLSDAIAENYKKAGVTEDKETWKNSKGYTLLDVNASLWDLLNSEYAKDPKYMEALNLVLIMSRKYFGKDSIRSNFFKNRVLIQDILEASLVVCSFGMAGKAPQSVDETQLALMQLGAAQISYQRSVYSKAQGKYNLKIWEEFQRWGNFPDSEKTIGVAVTGGRKLGDINVILTNNIKDILDNDRFGILGNWTSFMFGAIADAKVRKDLLERVSMQHMLKELDAIAKENKVDDEGYNPLDNLKNKSPLAFAFLTCLDRNKYGVARVENPDSISHSAIFKTGVDLKG